MGHGAASCPAKRAKNLSSQELNNTVSTPIQLVLELSPTAFPSLFLRAETFLRVDDDRRFGDNEAGVKSLRVCG